MKKHIYLFIVAGCLALSSCGMTDVWKDWEDEGTMSENRLRPSEVKDLLCSAEGWKMNYEGTTFYFCFTEGGNVTSDSDESLLQSEVETSYQLDYKGEKTVLLTLQGKGMLQYLPANAEETFVITAYSPQQVTAQGQTYGKPMTLTPATSAEMRQAKEVKRQAVIAYNKEQALEQLKTSLCSGLFRNAASQAAVAHYTMACDDDDNWTIRFSYLEGLELKHRECTMTVNTADDDRAILSFDGGITVNGTRLEAIYYGYDSGELSADNTNIQVDLNKASDMANAYTGGSWHTHVVDRDYICADFSGMVSQLEFDDRTPRNVVVCPGSTSEGDWWYVFFSVSTGFDDVSGRVSFSNTGISLPFGGAEEGIERAQNAFGHFLDFCFSPDGLYMYQDADEYIYAVSPSSALWFRMK